MKPNRDGKYPLEATCRLCQRTYKTASSKERISRTGNRYKLHLCPSCMTERMAAKQKKAWENKSNAGQIGVANDALRATASGIDALIKELAATMRREQITRVVVEVRGGTARCSMLRRSVSRVVVDD